jgi:hypothetical protein
VRYQHECAHLLAKCNPNEPSYTIGDVIDWRHSGNKLHPPQKPLSVLLSLVETFSPVNGTALRPVCRFRLQPAYGKTLGREYL